jgi:hypothetical protein
MPYKHILDPQFKYVNAASTDISKTFERVRKEQMVQSILKTSFPEFYFPIPETMDEKELAESYKLMHQDMDRNDPWGN